MRSLLIGRHLEGHDLTAARVDAAHYVLDRAVLPRGVHALEHDEHRVAALRVEDVLELRQLLDVARQRGARRLLVSVLAGVSGIDAGESHRSARPDTVVGHGRSQRPGKTSSSAAPSTEPQPVARS